MAEDMIGNRYQIIDKIGEGGMGAVYRALDRLTGREIALKRVTVDVRNLKSTSLTATNDMRFALAREFKVLASLRHPHIISVLDYGFDDDGQPFFTMELLENSETVVRFAADKSLDTQIDVWVQMLQALAYLHRRGILHRDLKPDNVLVKSDVVKVLDFGLAVPRDQIESNEGVVGTIAYMAPEVLMSGDVSEAADLHAVGIIVYELLAGKHPYDTSNFQTIIQGITLESVDVEHLPVNPELKSILAGLLIKDVRERYHNAGDVLTLVTDAADRADHHETPTIRESFLHGAAFIGREREFDLLNDALTAAQDGQGSAWLIGGESGVGKSRLLDELRTHAMVSGVFVLNGQSITGGGAPYHTWHDVIRLLSLQTELSDLEAGVLKSIIPDLEQLIGQTIPDAPDIEDDGAQVRLLTVIEDIFRKQTKPMLLLLEDLQWAGNSLNVLERLSRRVGEMPLMIIGSYRHDEYPTLPDILPQMEHMKLERLEKDAIERLVEGMVGRNENQPEVVDLLQRETEGNIFFIVEVMKTLAEDAGQLDRVGTRTLPSSVFSGSIQTIIQRRLDRVPGEARPLLEISAVAGRELDLKLMSVIFPDLDLDRLLVLCLEATVLEVQGETWRFAHDKLREGLLLELSDDRRRDLHRTIAEALEAVRANDLNHHATIAYHWEQSLDLEQPDPVLLMKAIDYLESAGAHALNRLAEQESLGFLTRLQNLETLRQQAIKRINNPPMEPAFQPIPTERQAHWHALLSETQHLLRRFDQSADNFEQAARLYGYPMPDGRFGQIADLLRQIAIHVAHRMFPQRFIGTLPAEKRETLMQVVRMYRTAGTSYFIEQQQLKSLYTTLKTVNLAERIGPSIYLAAAYGQIVNLVGAFGFKGQTEFYYRRGMEIAEAFDQPVNIAGVLFITGLYHTSAGLFERAIEDLTRGAEIFKRYGDISRWGIVQVTLASAYANQGDFEKAIELHREIYVHATDGHIIDQQVLSATFLGRFAAICSDMDTANIYINQVQTLLDTEQLDPGLTFNPWSVIAYVRLLQADYQGAYEAVTIASQIAEETNANASFGYVAFSQMVEVYMTLLEGDTGITIDRETIIKKVQKAVRGLRMFTPPTGKSSAWRAQGRLDWYAGKMGKAMKAWQQSLKYAESIRMPFELALAHYEIGRHMTADQPERDEHLYIAAEHFVALGAHIFLTAIRQFYGEGIPDRLLLILPQVETT